MGNLHLPRHKIKHKLKTILNKMKTRFFSSILLALAIIFSLTQCKKEEDNTSIPVLTTTLSNVMTTSALAGGNITSTGGAKITEQGICYSTTELPTISDSKVVDISGLKTFSTEITGLAEGTAYYVRAYAKNEAGTGYGEPIKIGTFANKTVTTGSQYGNDVYYSLTNGVVSTISRTDWDIAFSVSTRSSSIIINEGANVALWAYPNTWTWAGTCDTTGYKSWTTRLRNSNTDWEVGAFNANATGYPNYGWGVYNETTHNIANVDGGALYIVKLRNGSFKKIWIETKYSSLQKYAFRYADIDGSNEHVVSELNLAGYTGNYGYYSLVDNQLIANREPDKSTWELLFTKWEDVSSNQPYIVFGVLQNAGIKAIELTTTDFANITYTDAQFVSDINTIGYDWKTYAGAWTVANDKAYIVKNAAGKAYLVVFKTFAGSSTGTLTFDIREL